MTRALPTPADQMGSEMGSAPTAAAMAAAQGCTACGRTSPTGCTAAPACGGGSALAPTHPTAAARHAAPHCRFATAQGTGGCGQADHPCVCRAQQAQHAPLRPWQCQLGVPRAMQSNHWAFGLIATTGGWLVRHGLRRLGLLVAKQRFRLPALVKKTVPWWRRALFEYRVRRVVAKLRRVGADLGADLGADDWSAPAAPRPARPGKAGG